MPVYADNESADVLRGMLHTSHACDATHRRLAVISAYADMSGTPRSRVYTLGCYLGNERQWAAADKQWKAALEWAKVDHFHATDFFACGGAFRGWTKGSKRHREAERRFVSIASDATLAGIFVAVETAAFSPEFRALHEMVKPRYRVRTVRQLCAQLCFVEIRDAWRLIPQPHHERVSVAFEYEQGIGEVIDNFVAHKQRRASWTEGIISVTTAEKKALRPLQFADLLAYEAHQYVTHLASRPDAPLPPRLERLRSGQRTKGKFMTAANSQAIVPKIREWVTQHPEALTKEGRALLAAKERTSD